LLIGELWSRILKENARKEYEIAKYERDPLIINQMLVVGRDSLDKVKEKLFKKWQAIQDDIDKTRR